MKSHFNKILGLFLLVAITCSIVTVVRATAPNPGHDFTAIGGGVVQGDIIYGSAADTLSALAKDSNATRYLSNTGSSNNPAWAQVSLADGVSGDLPFANLTQGSALSVLGVTGNGTADNASIAAGSDYQVLRRSGTAVAFGAINLAQSAAVTGILPTANGGTGIAYFTAAGPTTARVYTFPDAAATVLTDNAAVTAGQGGTGQAGGYAVGDMLYASAAGTLSKLASVAAGSYLRSGGVTTAPVWSTPTLPNTAASLKMMIGNGTNWVESTPAYPNASATAGKVIVSDGTNYIASTPTFPNASATTRKIIVSDGTNWTASTETYATPGTSGNALVSDGTNWTSARPTGYTIAVQALTSSPADGATAYFGTMPKAPNGTGGQNKVYIRSAGTIKRAEIYNFSGTAGTNESWSLYVRLNATTDTLIATVGAATSERVFSNTSLSIAVSAGDYIEIKMINPTWATNPLTSIFGGYIYIE